MSFASSQCCLEQELEGKVLANLKSSLFSYLTRSHLNYVFGWWCFDTQDKFFFLLAHEQGYFDNNNNYILLLFILIEYLLSVIMFRAGLLSVDIGIWNEYCFFLLLFVFFWVIGNITLNSSGLQ